MKLVFAIVSILLSFAGFYPYFRDLFRGRTQPHIYTWLIWSITQGIAVAGLWRGDGGWGSIPLSISLACVCTVFVFSFRYGTRNITGFDTITLLGALISLGIWIQLRDPVLAVIVGTVVDIIGYFPTYRKSFEEPWSETVWTWLAFVAANVFSLLALKEYNLLTTTYLVAIFFGNFVVAAVCFVRRRSIPRPWN